MSSIARILACAQTQGAKRPTPTQSTCLYYDHDNEASKCVSRFMELILYGGLVAFTLIQPSCKPVTQENKEYVKHATYCNK